MIILLFSISILSFVKFCDPMWTREIDETVLWVILVTWKTGKDLYLLTTFVFLTFMVIVEMVEATSRSSCQRPFYLSWRQLKEAQQHVCVCVRAHTCAHACMLSSVWLCNPVDCSLPGSFVHAVFQARILEWVSISYSIGSSWRSNPPLLHLLCWQSDSLPLCHLGSIFIYIYVCMYIYIKTLIWI